ncbi:hypothetical protein MHYP_G00088950 [Metynnis hypsauchen]
MSLQQPNFRKVFIFVLGEKDHLIPSTSHFLSESDFSVAAGRMMGHSFLNGGPCLGGPPEEATTDIKDCADLDIREKIQLLLPHISWRAPHSCRLKKSMSFMSWRCPGVFLWSHLKAGDGCLTTCSSML